MVAQLALGWTQERDQFAQVSKVNSRHFGGLKEWQLTSVTLTFGKYQELWPDILLSSQVKIKMEGENKQSLAQSLAQELLEKIMFKTTLADILVLIKDTVQLVLTKDVGHQTLIIRI